MMRTIGIILGLLLFFIPTVAGADGSVDGTDLLSEEAADSVVGGFADFESSGMLPADVNFELIFAALEIEIPTEVSLETAVELALSHNHELASLQYKIDSAEAGLRGSRLLYMPSLDASGRSMSSGPASSMELPGPDGTPINVELGTTDPVWTASLTLNQPVYMFGSFSLARQTASIALDQARLDLERKEQVIRSTTEESFLQAALAMELVGVQKKAVETASERLRLAGIRFDAGDVAWFEVLRSEVSLATAEEQLLQMETATELAMSALVQVMGLPPGTLFNLVPPDLDEIVPSSPSFTLIEAWEIAFTNRADLASLNFAVNLAEIGVSSERNRPSLFFQGSYSYSDRPSGFGEKESWSLMLNFSYPIFDAGRASAAMDQARGTRESLEAQLDNVRSLIALEVESGYRTLIESLERIEVSGATVISAAEALRIAELGYGEGVITYLDYQDADLGYRQAEIMYVQAVYGYLIAESKLNAAMGN